MKTTSRQSVAETSDLVSALELITQFVPGGVKHKRVIPQPKPKPKSSKKRKRIDEDMSQGGEDGRSQVEGESSISSRSVLGLAGEKHQFVSLIEEEPATQFTDLTAPEETVLIEIEEIWDIEPSSIIGQGAFGTVRFERRRPLMANHTQNSQGSVRAVKEIRKLNSPDYMKELRAIARFTQPKYEQYFVQSYGWFQNEESVFITMEYWRLGDLAHFRQRIGPFLPETAGLVVRQVLEGIRYMHEINFAHRDLKPGNILVVTTSPWTVKIADFGISKQCIEGAQFQTQLGTPEYMAPEQKGHFRSIEGVHAYSLSVDIWAIGVITMELILTHPFLYNSDQEDYTRGIRPLDFRNETGAVISEACRDFVTSLLTPDPTHRPNAEVAISHPWFAEVAMWLDQHESPFAHDEVIPSQRQDDVTPSPRPLMSWSTFGNLRLTDRPTVNSRSTNSDTTNSSISTQGTRASSDTAATENSAIGTYHGRPFDPMLLASSFRQLSLNTWSKDWTHTDPDWIPRPDGQNYQGRFTLEWVCLNKLSFDGIKNVPAHLGKGRRAIAVMDGQEICAEAGYEFLRAYSEEHRRVPCRLDE
ncbi:hypothetical protein BLS_006753 [Venturia inaequalis]|uniref:Protein kinase domain-containing protein n=1 Tax=Venturia inaequalis TaxID=5025 RepID=A0A8H3YRI9_VENIN|nr:hypothetical protein BLS_006753 [Venturia inaequalis]